MNYIDLINKINSTKIPQDKKDYLISFIDKTVKANLTDSQKAYKINLAIDALNSYISESELKSIKTILADTFKVTVLELSKPFGNAFDFINFVTNPIVLAILLLIAIFIFYKYIMR